MQYNVGAPAGADARRSIFPTLAVVVLTPALIGLGFWQLDRARQKRELIDAFEQGGGGRRRSTRRLPAASAALYQR